ncbi:MAG: hypothetical protein HC915_18885, partial [Anaerolineae bacterium]|nr:hypothetical protein [Anaerolineae bacterium]
MDRNYILAPPVVSIDVTVDQTYTMFNTLMLLQTGERLSGVDPWLQQTFAALPPERQAFHQVFVNTVGDLLAPQGPFSSFLAYLQHLSAQSAAELHTQTLQGLGKWFSKQGNLPPEDWLSSPQRFTESLYAMIARHWEAKQEDPNPRLHEYLTTLYTWLQDPAGFQARVVGHLRWLWETVLAAEWARVEPILTESALAFRDRNGSMMAPNEAIRVITGRDLQGAWDEMLKTVTRLIFIPVPHIGPYVILNTGPGDLARILFGARLP